MLVLILILVLMSVDMNDLDSCNVRSTGCILTTIGDFEG
jgi:hypothetical protein